MPWDEETQEYYPGSRDRRPTVKCVMCGQPWDEEVKGPGGYVEINGSPVCSNKCKWEFIEEEFVEYLKNNNVDEKVKALASNPTLDGIIALRRELSEAASTETGEPADTNLVNAVLSPLFDAEDVMKRNLPEYLPELLTEAQKAVAEALAGPAPE